jgi:hypothetical protein
MMSHKFALFASMLLGSAVLQGSVASPCGFGINIAAGVNGTSVSLPATPFTAGTGGVCSFASTPGIPFFTSANLVLQSLGVTAFNDPYLNYSATFQNPGNTTMTYTLTETLPYTGGPYTSVSDSFADNVTDGDANGSVTIGRPAGTNFIAQPIVDGTNVDGINKGCTVTGSPGFSGPGCVTSNTMNTVPYTTLTSGNFGITLNFTLSPGDTYAFSGRVSLQSGVPEPASWSAMGLGLGVVLGLAYYTNRRKRAA